MDCANWMAWAVVMVAGSFSKPEPARFVIMVAMPEFAWVQFTVPLVVALIT